MITYSVQIREPFERKVLHEFETIEDARTFVLCVGLVLQCEVVADIAVNMVQTVGNC